MQPHLRKCFDNINRIEFKERNDEEENELEKIIGMISAEPETMPEMVEFSSPVVITPGDKVENWLYNIQVMMQTTLHDKTLLALNKYPLDKLG